MRKTMMALTVALCGAAAMAESEITWLEKTYNFGAFNEDTKEKKAVFRFVNTGSDDVAIISAAATCGCTVPAYSQEPIAPGDTASISVSYDPTGRPGRFEKNIYVRTTADNDRTKLTITGAVIGNAESVKGRYPVEMGPLRLRTGAVMFGRVRSGHAKMEYADGYNMSTDSIRLDITDIPPYLEIKVIPDVVPPGEMMQMDVLYRADAPQQWGIVTDSVTISPNGNGRYTLPIVAIVEEDFGYLTPEQRSKAPKASLAADRIDLGTVPRAATEPVTGAMKLTNRGSDPLLVRRVYSQDPGVSVEMSADTIKKGKSADIIVTVDPAKVPDDIINARVTVITNDPDNPMLVLRVVAER